MSGEVVAVVLTGTGVLLGVWRLVESVRRDLTGALHREIGSVREDIGAVRRDLTAQIAAVNTRIDGAEARLTSQIAAVNTRIDNVLLADRGAARETA